MKNFLLLIFISFSISAGYAQAAATQPATNVKAPVTSSTSGTAKVHKTHPKTVSATTGSAATNASTAGTSAASGTAHAPVKKHMKSDTTGIHTKADGSPDKRYAANKHLKKDGTKDQRFKENKPKQ